jgi:hypothetical protein
VFGHRQPISDAGTYICEYLSKQPNRPLSLILNILRTGPWAAALLKLLVQNMILDEVKP